MTGAPMKAYREGFTTGSCATAAALACCLWQRDGACPAQVSLTVPEGRTYIPVIIPHEDGSCGVIKDSGDDPDVTNGMEVCAQVKLLHHDGEIVFIAGDGVGVVTEDGLKIPKGGAAINPVPRSMIEQAVRSVYGSRAAEVTISIPGGKEMAKKTFNPRLGIEGGLSVLGTSGVVRPMSDEALRDALLVELNMRVAQGHDEIVYAFGNQGEEALRQRFPEACIVQMSNEVGFMLDSARELGVRRIILGGHPGKMSKVAAGVMHTHSKYGDARREAIITQLALTGAPRDLMEQVYACVTTDAAMALIKNADYDGVWLRVAQAAKRYCELRVRGETQIDVVLVNTQGDVIAETLEESR